MDLAALDLPLIWAGIIAFGVFMYVFMDGFDLGLGILFPFAPDNAGRDIMAASVAPVWDANETWLVLGGVGLLAAFPMAFAIILPALYMPLTVMLLALIFRGVAFEFRGLERSDRRFWDRAFHVGSLVATFAQGIVLGAFVQGFPVEEGRFVGSQLGWLTPFSLFTGLGLVAGYALLGATWTVMKTTGPLQQWAMRTARVVVFAVVAFIVAVSLWTPFLRDAIFERWFSWPNIAYLSPVPILTGLLTLGLLRALYAGREIQPFVFALGLFLLSYAGLAITLWPSVVPPDISIWEAASAPASQAFLLAGTAIVVPIILLYTAWTYYIFRGKTSEDAGYH